MPRHRTQNPPDADLSAALVAFGEFAARRVGAPENHVPEVAAEATACLLNWIAYGPQRLDRTSRFPRWDAESASLALRRRVRVEPLLRGQRRGRMRVWHGPVRVWLDAPRPVWRHAIAAAARCLSTLDLARPRPAPKFNPGPDFAEIARDFAAGIADRALMLAGSWSQGAAFRDRVHAAAVGAVDSWLRRKGRYAGRVRMVLLVRLGKLDRFAKWPRSLVREVRAAAELAAGLIVRAPARTAVRIAA